MSGLWVWGWLCVMHVTWTLVDDSAMHMKGRSARGQNDQKSRVYHRLGNVGL